MVGDSAPVVGSQSSRTTTPSAARPPVDLVARSSREISQRRTDVMRTKMREAIVFDGNAIFICEQVVDTTQFGILALLGLRRDAKLLFEPRDDIQAITARGRVAEQSIHLFDAPLRVGESEVGARALGFEDRIRRMGRDGLRRHDSFPSGS